MLRLAHFWGITWSRPVVVSIFVLIIPLVMTGFTLPSLAHKAAALTKPVTTLADLAITKSPLHLQANLSATGNAGQVAEIAFVMTTSSTTPINLADGSLEIDYRDRNQRHNNLAWSWQFLGVHNHDAALDRGEQLQVKIALAHLLKQPLGANQNFVIELKPAKGAIRSLRTTTPAHIDAQMDFYPTR